MNICKSGQIKTVTYTLGPGGVDGLRRVHLITEHCICLVNKIFVADEARAVSQLVPADELLGLLLGQLNLECSKAGSKLQSHAKELFKWGNLRQPRQQLLF